MRKSSRGANRDPDMYRNADSQLGLSEWKALPRETLLLRAAAYNLVLLGTKPVLALRLYNHVQQISAESFAVIPQNDAPTSLQQPSLPSSAANNNNVVSISLHELRTIIREEISTTQPQHHRPLSPPSVILEHEMDTQEAPTRPPFQINNDSLGLPHLPEGNMISSFTTSAANLPPISQKSQQKSSMSQLMF